MTSLPDIERGVLSGHGCDRQGGFLVIDAHAEPAWRRQRLHLRGLCLTLECVGGKFCTGRHDLDRGRSEPCPARAALGLEAPEQCTPCWRATGFNPAFYNALEISPQQQRRNLEPHLVYLAHFGAGTLKVGITHERRGIERLLEQGARMGVLLARFADAYLARALEERIARSLGVLEAVRPTRKRHLLGASFSESVAAQELDSLVQQVRELAPDLPLCPERVALDEYYGGTALFEQRLSDLSETEPLAISGRCVGMIGDVLLVSQAGQIFMLGLGALVGRGVRLCAAERPNRLLGQLALPF